MPNINLPSVHARQNTIAEWHVFAGLIMEQHNALYQPPQNAPCNTIMSSVGATAEVSRQTRVQVRPHGFG